MAASVKNNTGRSPRPGRPSNEDAQAIPARIVAAATALFIEAGFEAASMDLIARRARVSKRTLYARFHSKDEVFLAAVEETGMRRLADLDALKISSRTLGASLAELAGKLVETIIVPDLIAFERIIAAEARRFPQLAEERSRRGMDRLRSVVGCVLKKHPPFDAMAPDELARKAEIFVSMAVLPSLRAALFSDGPLPAADEALIAASVEIFLHGAAPHERRAHAAARAPARKPRSTRALQTRARILDAAMRCFSRASYDDVGLRDIAADAGVDAAHVHRSFGSKQALFMAALEEAAGADTLAELLKDPSALPDAIAALFVTREDRRDGAVSPMDIMIRSLGSPTARTALRDRMLADLLRPLSQGLAAPGETRASMILAVLLGAGISAQMLDLPGLARADAADGTVLAASIRAIMEAEVQPL